LRASTKLPEARWLARKLFLGLQIRDIDRRYDSCVGCLESGDGEVIGDEVASSALRGFVPSSAESLDNSNRMAARNVIVLKPSTAASTLVKINCVPLVTE
jgi:hypothetical protein